MLVGKCLLEVSVSSSKNKSGINNLCLLTRHIELSQKNPYRSTSAHGRPKN